MTHTQRICSLIILSSQGRLPVCIICYIRVKWWKLKWQKLKWQFVFHIQKIKHKQPCETAAVLVHVLCTPCNNAPLYDVTLFDANIQRVHACLVVTCHLHFWQKDQDLLRATVVTQGWNRYRRESARKVNPGQGTRNFSRRCSRQDLNPWPNHWARLTGLTAYVPAAAAGCGFVTLTFLDPENPSASVKK